MYALRHTIFVVFRSTTLSLVTFCHSLIAPSAHCDVTFIFSDIAFNPSIIVSNCGITKEKPPHHPESHFATLLRHSLM